MSSLARHETSKGGPGTKCNVLLTRSVVWMDRTPVKTPYRRSSVEHVGTTFRQELSCERSNEGTMVSAP
jgi:hypothetical protein